MHPNRYLSVFLILLTLSDLVIVESMDKDKFCATFMFLDAPDPSHNFTNIHTLHDFCQREHIAGPVPSGA